MREGGRWLLLSVTALVLTAGCHPRSTEARREAREPARQLPAATHVEVPFLEPSARQVLDPVGVAVSDSGGVYLLDEATGLIKECSARGEPVRELRVVEPRSLTAGVGISQCLVRERNGNLLLSDAKHGVVRRLDSQGRRVGQIRVLADRSERHYAIITAPDSKGNVYVATPPGVTVRKYGPDGRMAWDRAVAQEEPPGSPLGAVAADPQGRLWAWLSESTTVLILDPDGRGPVRRIERSLGDRSEWGEMVAACFDRHGNRYELSFETSAGYGTDIAKLDPQGRVLWVRNMSAVEGTGLAVDSSGRAFITLRDYKFTAATCVMFSPEGRESVLIAPNSALPGEIRDPSGLAVDRAGNVYAGDYYTFRVEEFASDGEFLGGIIGPHIAASAAQHLDAEGRLDSPASIAVGPDGLIYVTHGLEQTISVFSRAGARVQSYPKVSLGWGGPTDDHFGASPQYPASIALDSGGHMWTAVGLEPKELSMPHWRGTFSAEGIRVAEYDRAGRKLRSFGDFGDKPGAFGRKAEHLDVIGISDSLLAVGQNGTVWVVDRANNRVQQFDQKGRFLKQIGPKIGDVSLDHPWGVAVGGQGHLYVGDDRTILEFRSGGKFAGLVARLGGDRPYYESEFAYRYRALAVDRSGSVYLSDGGLGAVRKFVPRARGSR